MTEAEGPRRPRLVRGRALALGIVLCAMFVLGRITAPEGTRQEELRAAEAALALAQRQAGALELALQARAEAETPEPSPTTLAPDPAETDASGRRVYTVQSGDSMRGIAETFCGDADLAGFVASFNDLADPESISIGMELKLPRDCDL